MLSNQSDRQLGTIGDNFHSGEGRKNFSETTTEIRLQRNSIRGLNSIVPEACLISLQQCVE